jgi:actin-related protein
LALRATDRKTGLVVSSGENISRIVPVREGKVVDEAFRALNIGGSQVSSYLEKLMSEKGQNISTNVEHNLPRKSTVLFLLIQTLRANQHQMLMLKDLLTCRMVESSTGKREIHGSRNLVSTFTYFN